MQIVGPDGTRRQPAARARASTATRSTSATGSTSRSPPASTSCRSTDLPPEFALSGPGLGTVALDAAPAPGRSSARPTVPLLPHGRLRATATPRRTTVSTTSSSTFLPNSFTGGGADHARAGRVPEPRTRPTTAPTSTSASTRRPPGARPAPRRPRSPSASTPTRSSTPATSSRSPAPPSRASRSTRRREVAGASATASYRYFFTGHVRDRGASPSTSTAPSGRRDDGHDEPRAPTRRSRCSARPARSSARATQARRPARRTSTAAATSTSASPPRPARRSTSRPSTTTSSRSSRSGRGRRGLAGLALDAGAGAAVPAPGRATPGSSATGRAARYTGGAVTVDVRARQLRLHRRTGTDGVDRTRRPVDFTVGGIATPNIG